MSVFNSSTVIVLKFSAETVRQNKSLKINRENLKLHSEVHRTFEFILSEPRKQNDVSSAIARLVKIA